MCSEYSLPDGWNPQFVANSEFFAFVRAVERDLWDNRIASSAEETGHTALEDIEFSACNSLGFPASDITLATVKSDPVRKWSIESTCFGLTGAVGAMPPHFTSWTFSAGDADRSGLRDFLQVIDNRCSALFFRAWERSQWLFRRERAIREQAKVADPFSLLLASLVALVTSSKVTGPAFSANIPCYYSGAYSSLRRPANQLGAILREVMGIPAQIIEHVGRWREIGDALRSRIGRDTADAFPEQDSRNSRLGRTTCIGTRVWTCQDSFCVSLGPLDYDSFCKLIPSGSLYAATIDLVRLYAGPELQFSLQLLLKADAVPRCCVGRNCQARLGWNTWLKSRPFRASAEDCVLDAPFTLSRRVSGGTRHRSREEP